MDNALMKRGYTPLESPMALTYDPLLSTRIAVFAPVPGDFYVNTLECNPSTVTMPCNSRKKERPHG